MRRKNDPQKAFVALVIVFLVLFAAGLSSRGITMYQLTDAIFISPLKKTAIAIRYAGNTVKEARAFLISKKRLLEQNSKLIKENKTLEEEIKILKSQEMQNERLKEILNLEITQNYKLIVANVIGNTETPFNFIIADKGKKNGISPGDPVIIIDNNIQKLVGIVYSVSNNTSKILGLTDPRFFVSVKDAYTGEIGIAQGNKSSSLEMTFKMKTPDIQAGDPLLTTSLSNIYPEGILVGTVKSIKKKNNISTIVRIEPSANIYNLFEVVIIKK